jgi:hypothetical protein
VLGTNRKAGGTVALLAVVVGIVVVAGGRPEAEAAAHRCVVPHGAKVFARSRNAVVYSGGPPTYRTYACLRGGKARLRVASSAFYELAGRYVAYSRAEFDPDGTDHYQLIVRDLRTGGYRHHPGIYKEPGVDRNNSDAGVTDVTLRKNGSVAWISCLASDTNGLHCYRPDADYPYQVWRLDTRGLKKLDESAAIAKRSLERSVRKISWRDGGETKTATLK